MNTGEVKPTADATFIAATMEMTTTRGSETNDLNGPTTGTGGTTSNRSTVFDTPGFTASYDATTGYQVTNAINNVAFGPSQLTGETAPAVTFAKVAPGVGDYLALYKQSVTTSSILGSGTFTPKYGGTGGWQHTVTDSGTHRTRLDYFAFGAPTPASAMPHSGVVKFTLMGSGNYAADTELYFTRHLDTITVDFGAGTFSGSITGTGDNFFTGGVGGVYSVGIAGTITGNMAAGLTTSSVAVASGQFRLLFVGPNADEFIVTHVGQNGRGTYVGASVGVRNPYAP